MLRNLRLCAAVTALALVAALTAPSAFAHSRPVRFDPAPGAVLTAAPDKVTGWFTADIRRDPNWSFLHVTDAQGNRVDAGEATLTSDRLQMSVNLKPRLAAGRYLVSWRTWDDADGAIFGDCYAFFVGQAAADAAASAKTRLDGGRDCQRIDVSARDGTPTAGGTPQATSAAAATGDDENVDDEPGAVAAEGGGNKLDWWLVVPGIVGGLAVGLVGARMISGKARL